MEQVILVDEQDRQTGVMEKIEAHRKGLLHRAISVVVFNSRSELLLQQRAFDKYHSAGLWTNTCCSHPRPGESTADAARRRLKEEMGIDLQPSFAYSFRYKAALENNLIEHELDHVFTAIHDEPPSINTREVANWKYMSLADLHLAVLLNPHEFTPWFRLMLSHQEFQGIFKKK
jgi:isopentenyl-diphosphate delta-isomerase